MDHSPDVVPLRLRDLCVNCMAQVGICEGINNSGVS
jgi:hypothetical protein